MQRPSLQLPGILTSFANLDASNPEAAAASVDFLRVHVTKALEADTLALDTYFTAAESVVTDLSEARKNLIATRAAAETAVASGKAALKIIANPTDTGALQEAESLNIDLSVLKTLLEPKEHTPVMPTDASAPAAPDAQSAHAQSTHATDEMQRKVAAMERMVAEQRARMSEMEAEAKSKAEEARRMRLMAELTAVVTKGDLIVDGVSGVSVYPDSLAMVEAHFREALYKSDTVMLRNEHGIEVPTIVLETGETLKQAVVRFASSGGAGYRLFHSQTKSSGSLASAAVGTAATAANIGTAPPTLGDTTFDPTSIVRRQMVKDGKRGGELDTMAITRAITAARAAGNEVLVQTLEHYKEMQDNHRAKTGTNLFLEY